MLRVVLLVAACAGCASVPEQEANTTRDPDGLELTDETEISGTGFSMSFAKSGVRLPTSLVHGAEVFGQGACPSPSRAGASIEPFQTAVGEHSVAGLDPAKNTLAATLSGPVVMQMDVTYDVPYFCEGPQSLRGTATFAVFWSGRIVRHDRVQPTDSKINSAVACSVTCDGTQRDATFDVFWALAAGGERYEIVGGADKLIRTGDTANTVFSCAAYATHTAAIAWNDVATARTSESVITGTLTYAHDFFTQSGVVEQAMKTASSTLLVVPGKETCTNLAALVRLPATLVLDDGSTERDLGLDAFEIYSATLLAAPLGGRIEIRPRGDEAVNASFAVRLNLGSPKHLSVTRRSGEKHEYLLQRDGAQTIIGINDGIASGDAVIIEVL